VGNVRAIRFRRSTKTTKRRILERDDMPWRILWRRIQMREMSSFLRGLSFTEPLKDSRSDFVKADAIACFQEFKGQESVDES
jgi:hypothetical protein